MLFVVDVGNTNTVFALFEEQEKQGLWRIATSVTRTADEYAVFLNALLGEDKKKITGCIISSVVPALNFNLIKLCRDYFRCEPLMVGNPKLETGLKIEIDNPSELGGDRIINAVAAIEKYDEPLLIIDFGTATTFDLIENKTYKGGVIAPGVNLSIKALHMAAAQLPCVEIKRPPKTIATGTVSAIQSGIFWGYIGLIEGLITRIKHEFGKPLRVIATGGLASLFTQATNMIDEVDSDLALRGLVLIFKNNAKD